jgi:hypothetical protein
MPLSSETKGIRTRTGIEFHIFPNFKKNFSPTMGALQCWRISADKGIEGVITFKRTILCNRDYKGYLKDIFLIENEIFVFFFKISFFQR